MGAAVPHARLPTAHGLGTSQVSNKFAGNKIVGNAAVKLRKAGVNWAEGGRFFDRGY